MSRRTVIATHTRHRGARATGSHASWLLAGGADPQVVRERLGRSIPGMTEKHLHREPNADQTALAALDQMHAR
jgi:hypothetical protein